MKKIAALIVIATVFASGLMAQASVNGWFETKGFIGAPNAKDIEDEDAKALTRLGTTSLSLTMSYYGDGFGTTVDLGSWTGQDTALTAPAVENAWIYADLLPGMLTVYGTVHNLPLNYSPSAAVEGGMNIFTTWGGLAKPFDDGFGMGLGAYNYKANGNLITSAITGAAAEVKVAGLSAAAVVNFADAQQLEDTKVILNAKYDAGVATIYGGFATGNAASRQNLGEASDWVDAPVHGNSLWVAASTSLVEGLLADVKYEMTQPSGEDYYNQSMISANLGYSMDMVSIASEINFSMTDKDVEDWEKDDLAYLMIGAKISTGALGVADLALNIGYQTFTGDGADVEDRGNPMLIGLDVSKSVGNVGTTFSIGYQTLDTDPDLEISGIVAGYSINIWF